MPGAVANQISHLPPTSALFAAFLGYNPMATLLPGNVLHALSAANQARLLGRSFFPNLISPPFLLGLHNAFYLSAFVCLVAALASLLRGKRYLHDFNPFERVVKAHGPQVPLLRKSIHTKPEEVK